MQGLRTGDIDPAIVQYLVKKYGLDWDELFEIMNKKSGLLGISGVSRDVRVIEGRAKKGDERCALALEMFTYRAAKYIGAYAVALGKVDAVVFTGGIGENAHNVRREICSYLKVLGVKIDARRNKKTIGKEGVISGRGSKIPVLVVPTDEEIMIAREAVDVLKGK